MQYKMLVLDLDDTLLRDDHTISDRTIDALIKAQELGVYVVLASGRPTPAMLQYVELLKQREYNSYLISFNGAVITDLSDNSIIFEQSLSKEEVDGLYDFSVENNLEIISYLDGNIIGESRSKHIEVEVNLTKMDFITVDSFKSSIKESAIKCIMLDNPDRLKVMEGVLKSAKPNNSISISKPIFLEIMADGIDKAASVAFLAEKLSINQDEIIAVGNAGNDLTMVEYAGLGVWVDNVTPELRDRADLIVSSNNSDGVAEVVEKFIL